MRWCAVGFVGTTRPQEGLCQGQETEQCTVRNAASAVAPGKADLPRNSSRSLTSACKRAAQEGSGCPRGSAACWRLTLLARVLAECRNLLPDLLQIAVT